MFSDWVPRSDDGDRTAAWRDLSASFRRKRKDLLDALLFRIAGTKGGSARVQIIDASQIRPTLSSLLSTWQLGTELPSDPRTEFSFLVDLRMRFSEVVAGAVESERSRLLNWDE